MTTLLAIVVEPLAGEHLRCIVDESLRIARQLNVLVCFKMNGVEISVSPNSKPESVIEHYQQEIERFP